LVFDFDGESKCSIVCIYLHSPTNGNGVTTTLTDVSTQTERYNKFQFIEGTTGTLLEGEHEYSVSTSGGTLCEIGILKVETTSSVTQYTPTLIEKIHTI